MQKKPDIKIRKDGADITYENGDKIVFSYIKERGSFSRYVHHSYLDYLSVEYSFLNAELYEGNSSMLLKWRINSKYYDRSNKKQRVLRLISYNNGFFNDGKVITNETTDFAWYDENGDRTVDPGITITVSDFDENTGCKITIAPAS